MFSRKKPEPPKRKNRDLSQFGIFDISDDFDPSQGFNDDGNDSDLEAELAAITAGGGGGGERKTKPKSIIPTADLDRMVADSMKDIGSDEELSEDDDDPDLLGELQEITGEPIENLESSSPKAASPEDDKEPEQIFLPTTTTNVIDIIRQRIEMYKVAEEHAKTTGEAGKARRFNRGLKSLQDLLKQATGGKNINVDDIPPEVFVKKSEPEEPTPDSTAEEKSPQLISPTSPARPAPPPPNAVLAPQTPSPTSPDSSNPELPEIKPINPKLVAINARKQEYKIAALAAKRAGDKASAIQYLQIIKQFDAVTKMIETGQEVDLSDMPPPPEQLKEFLEKMQAGGGGVETAQTEVTPAAPLPVAPAVEPEGPLPPPKNMLEALEQRLNKYKSVEEGAKNEGNTSKARRFGRIVKQYEDAIKLHKRGKQFPIDELPIPPGFGPLPTDGSTEGPVAPESIPQSPVSPPASKQDTPKSSPKESPTSSHGDSDGATPKPQGSPKKLSPNKPELTTRISGNQVSTNLAERQMQILLERQKEFKVAAIEAKKAGEIEQAKEYLKIYKGFEGLLNAASSGLPVDLNTLPIPPSQRENLEDSFAIVTDDIVDPNDEISDISVRLEEQLAKQLMMCKNTRDHHRAMGDIAGMNRFENLALTVQKDLDLVRYSRKKNTPIPKFHYEKRSFNIVHCNTDLTDNELEINVIRGITYNVQNPKEVDTYVKVEFPYPQDNFFNGRTNVIKNTESPDYDEKYIVEIQRTNRQCQRLFKRQSAKFEVYSKGCCLGGICRKLPMCCFSGFFRSDILIGTVNVKLQQLETKCDIHDSYDLMDGRKTIGGKLEIKIRVRNPILTKQIEHINEKWLVLGTANN